MQNEERFAEDFNEQITRLSELASALPQDIKSLLPASDALPSANMAGATALFKLLDYYEGLSNSGLQNAEIVAVIAKALSNKRFRLADEKTVILDDYFGYSILSRVIYANYPLSLIAEVLERPEAKSLVRFSTKRNEKGPLIRLLLTCQQFKFLPSSEEKRQRIEQWTQCVSAYLLHIEHPWQTFLQQFIYIRQQPNFDDQILNLLLEKIGPFPWHEKASFSLIKNEKEFSLTLPELGICLLAILLACENISIKSLEKFIGEEPVEWLPLINRTQLIVQEDFPIYHALFNIPNEFARQEEFNDGISEGKESKDKMKPRTPLNERLIFLLKKRIIKVTDDLLDKIYSKEDDLLNECLRFLTPQALCEDPVNAIKILLRLIENQYPLAQIKTFLPKDIKETAALLNTPIPEKRSTLLGEIASNSYNYEAKLQFLLDLGCHVTGRIIKNCPSSLSLNLLMDHLRKAGPAWYQQPQQGYEILLAMIETQQPIEEIQYYLQLEDKDTSGVLNYVSPDGLTTFSNLLDSMHYRRGDHSALVQILIQNGAIITGKSLELLLGFNPDLGIDLLAGCDFKEICKKPPRHGAELISCIIKNVDDPIKQLQPWLESKEEKSVNAILAHDMSETSPLSQFLTKIEGPINQVQSNFILLLIRKGAIPSGPDLISLTNKMSEPFVPVMLANLNTQHLMAHSPEKIAALLAATITLGWPCASVKKLFDFEDPNTLLTKVVNSYQSGLLPVILRTWLKPDRDQNNLLQLIQLLVDKGYRLSGTDFQNFELIPLEHRSLIWAVLAKAPFNPTENYETVNIICDFLNIQAPLERIKQLLQNCQNHNFLFEKIVSLLNAGNCAYLLTIILSLSIDPNYYYLNSSLKKLIKSYPTMQDAVFKKVIAVIMANFFSTPSPDPHYIKDFLIERSKFCLVTADYFSQAEMILREKTGFLLPAVLVNIIWNYIFPSKLEKLLLEAVQNEVSIDNDEKFPIFLTSLPVIVQQAELGFCAAHAAFNAQLPRAMSWMSQTPLQAFFNANSKDHPLAQLTEFFLEKSHETKQGEEDGTPIHMRQLLQKKSLTDEITIVPITESKAGLCLGHGDFTLSLEMFKNLLQLHQRFLNGKRVTHSFVISFNNVHWFATSWIGKQSKKSMWLGMDSNPVINPGLKKICQMLQELITEKNLLKDTGRRILLQGNEELKPLLGRIDSARVLLSYLNPIQALLEVYFTLAKSPGSLSRLLNEDQRNQFQQIAALMNKFVTPEIADDFTICIKIIKALEKSPLLVQASGAAILTVPSGPGLLAPGVLSAAVPVVAPSAPWVAP